MTRLVLGLDPPVTVDVLVTVVSAGRCAAMALSAIATAPPVAIKAIRTIDVAAMRLNPADLLLALDISWSKSDELAYYIFRFPNMFGILVFEILQRIA